MPPATDQMLARYVGEIEERSAFIEGLVQAAQEKGEDLSDDKLELITRAKDRIDDVNTRMKPLEEARRISHESADRVAQIARFMQGDDKPREMNYRSAGEYVLDYWKSRAGVEDASYRINLYHRAAAHQTTADNPGLLPQQILGPVLNFIDTARPLITALGARDLPRGGAWARPRITQHTQVGPQSGEKQELVSRKMLIDKLAVSPVTLGGYVNVSRQDIDWTIPSIMDMVINDLAGQYAIQSEAKLGADLVTGSTAADSTTTIPTGAATAAGVATAVWNAAGKVMSATQGQGRLILAVAPDMLGMIAPIFPPVNPMNAQSTGFSTADLGQGQAGSVAGVTVIMSSGLAAGTILMLSSAAAEVYEDRIGALQVVEPSVLGVQVAYAGYFTDLVLLPTGVQRIVKTP